MKARQSDKTLPLSLVNRSAAKCTDREQQAHEKKALATLNVARAFVVYCREDSSQQLLSFASRPLSLLPLAIRG